MSTPLRLKFSVTFVREYHVGAGHGHGTGVDSALFREPAVPDLPDGSDTEAIRYGHGVLRQAASALARVLPAEGWERCKWSGGPPEREYCEDPHVACPVCRIFGTPASPSRWRFSSLRPLDFSFPAGMEHVRPEGDTRIIRRAGMDLRLRRPEEKRLFAEEAGAPRVFSFDAECDPTTPDTEARRESAFLVYAARGVRGVGRGRRRGRGECAIDLMSDPPSFEPPSAEDLALAFREGWLTPGGARRGDTPWRPPEAGAEAGGASVWADAGTTRDIEVEVLMLLREPVIAGTRLLAGNVLGTESFVPGTTFLGAIAGMALRSGKNVDRDFLRTFRGGGASFPDLHPVRRVSPDTFLPTLPSPVDLYTCPVCPGPPPNGHGLWSPYARVDGGPHRCPVCSEGNVKLRRLGSYMCRSTEHLEFEPLKREETKISIDPETGRVLGESLYHREVIPAGTLLSGVLRLDRQAADYLEPLIRWSDRIGGNGRPEWSEGVELRLGKRHSRGYGRCSLVARTASPDHGMSTDLAAAHTGGHVTILLTSRAVVRDVWGRTGQSLTPEDFGLSMPPNPEPPNPEPGAIQAPRAPRAPAAVRSVIVGGHWRHLAMPRTEDLALCAGSTLHLRKEDYRDGWGDLLPQLQALALRPAIGARQEEGFGRFVLSPFPYAYLGRDPRDLHQLDAPTELLPHGFRVVTPPRAHRERPSRLRQRYTDRLIEVLGGAAGLGPKSNASRWHTVARILHECAGQQPEEVIRSLIDSDERGGRRRPEREIGKAGNAAREEGAFLRVPKKGGNTWKVLEPIVQKAAGQEDRVLAALHTRALADALAGLAADLADTDEPTTVGGAR